jgi:hypothetical protein
VARRYVPVKLGCRCGLLIFRARLNATDENR